MLDGFVRHSIAAAADEMAETVAAEGVAGEQDDVDRHHNRPNADTKTVSKLS